MTWLEVLIAVFATYRVARMVVLEHGPWDVFTALRTGVHHYVRGRGDHWVWQGINCRLCVGWWVAGLIALGFLLAGRMGAWEALLLWQGIAGGAAALQATAERSVG